MRADLQALIDYTGLSLREAAAYLGLPEATLSRKLSGKERYAAREEEIENLAGLAQFQDDQVEAAHRAWRELNERHPAGLDAPNRVAIISYRHDGDLPPWDRHPCASASRMTAARVKKALPDAVILVPFDVENYSAWRDDRPDTRRERMEWATHRSLNGRRFALKLNTTSIGWAVMDYGPDVQPRVIEAGEAPLPRRR